MCRLTAYAGASASPANIVFGGEHSLYRQSWQPKELLSGSVNADGYGVTWYADGRPARIAEARPIWFDDDLRGILDAVRTTTCLAALRNGTPGLPVDRSGVLPMVFERWTFVLNGFVPDFRASHMRGLRALLPDDLYGALQGVSDSETLLLLAVDHLRGGATLVEALTTTAATVLARTGADETQLLMAISDGARIAAVRTSNVATTNSLYWCAKSRLMPEGTLLASEPLTTDDRWTEVQAHSWIDFDTTGDVRTGAIRAV